MYGIRHDYRVRGKEPDIISFAQGKIINLAEVLGAAGYDTAIIGKWHLGDRSPSLPSDLGFDSFYGLLFSNDQGEPVLWKDHEVVEHHPIDQSSLTWRYTERAVEFIESHSDRPFFLYLPHTFPHVPLHVAADRRGRSAAGLYGDVDSSYRGTKY